MIGGLNLIWGNDSSDARPCLLCLSNMHSAHKEIQRKSPRTCFHEDEKEQRRYVLMQSAHPQHAVNRESSSQPVSSTCRRSPRPPHPHPHCHLPAAAMRKMCWTCAGRLTETSSHLPRWTTLCSYGTCREVGNQWECMSAGGRTRKEILWRFNRVSWF